MINSDENIKNIQLHINRIDILLSKMKSEFNEEPENRITNILAFLSDEIIKEANMIKSQTSTGGYGYNPQYRAHMIQPDKVSYDGTVFPDNLGGASVRVRMTPMISNFGDIEHKKKGIPDYD